MSRWPTVVGRITSSWKVLEGERIRYAYEVQGRRYVGYQVAWQDKEWAGHTGASTNQELAELELQKSYRAPGQ